VAGTFAFALIAMARTTASIRSFAT